MAIKNTLLGGTDWTNGTKLEDVDLNDTFDAVVDKIQTLSAFWLNSDLYDVYDDFDSYSVGSFTTATSSKWAVNIANDTNHTSTCNVVSSTSAGGSTQELELKSSVTGAEAFAVTSCEAIAETLSENKHTWFRLYWYVDYGTANTNGATTFSISSKIEGQSYVDAIVSSSTNGDSNGNPIVSGTTDLLCVALGSNNYDVYVGGKKIFSNVNTSDLKIYFRTLADWNTGTTFSADVILRIDDVRQSKSEII